MGRQGERATCGRRSSLHGIATWRTTQTVSEPNAHISPPSTRGMDGTVPRVEDRAIPRKQKDATVPRVEPPPKSDSCVKNTCDEEQKALARVREILG